MITITVRYHNVLRSAAGVVEEAVSVPADADDRVLEAKRQELENELRRITAEAESFFDSKEKSDQGR